MIHDQSDKTFRSFENRDTNNDLIRQKNNLLELLESDFSMITPIEHNHGENLKKIEINEINHNEEFIITPKFRFNDESEVSADKS